MGPVNSRRENRASERGFELPAPAQGAQPPAKNGQISGLSRADQRTERVSPKGVLAEGEELSSNPLRRVFNDLRTTQIVVDVDWRIKGLLRRFPLLRTRTTWAQSVELNPAAVGLSTAPSTQPAR
jgi:hypothetical protein